MRRMSRSPTTDPKNLRPDQCQRIIERQVGVMNIRGGNGRGIATFSDDFCNRKVKGDTKFCWQHQETT